jgi:hypothetical protein
VFERRGEEARQERHIERQEAERRQLQADQINKQLMAMMIFAAITGRHAHEDVGRKKKKKISVVAVVAAAVVLAPAVTRRRKNTDIIITRKDLSWQREEVLHEQSRLTISVLHESILHEQLKLTIPILMTTTTGSLPLYQE